MVVEPLKPIFSSRAEDTSCGEAVDALVVGLAEQIDMLQDAEADGDLAQTADLAGALVLAADATGFEALAGAARALAAACAADDAKAALERLLQLTEIAQRVRLGHKGAI